ncbi:MAG TPA: glycosyltransferase [Nitrosopumilaceae archaeon]|nr:glycosyltransferase [Nitrosopumilaceae archaeon]
MEQIIEIFNYIIAAILIGVSAAWIILIKSMLISFRDTPFLDKFEQKVHSNPKVSVIVPARNEEDFISRCLDSLLIQDYPNYEIVVIDDSSDDSTGQIIKKYSEKYSKIIHVSARPKPEDWMGKNWACMEGYKKSTGELLLCTDSDTKHSNKIISLAVAHLESEKIDALTVIPKMLCLDNLTRITLPMLSTFLHTRFSAIRVNNPSKKTGYFFGSFFIIKKTVYEAIGTHEGVKHEIIEDGALGKKVKEFGFKLKMVRGEHLLEAVWARNWSTLWNGLKRLMVPLFLQNNFVAIGVFFTVLFLLFMPFPILFYSILFFNESISFTVLLFSSIIASCFVYLAGMVDATKGLQIKWIYSIFAPVGSFITVSGFLFGMLQAKSKTAVSWRGRKYSMKEHITNSISV